MVPTTPRDAAFQGFSPAVFEWFAGLERDNSKRYFAATRERYETEVRGGLEAMLAASAAMRRSRTSAERGAQPHR